MGEHAIERLLRIHLVLNRLLDNIRLHLVVDLQEIVRVYSCIQEHVFGQGPFPPVRHLVLLICFYTAIVFEKIRVGTLLMIEVLSCMKGVEEIGHSHVEVSMEPLDIHVRTMEYFKNSGVVKNLVQLRNDAPQWQDVYDEILRAGGYLDQTSKAIVTFFRVLQVHCYFWLLR